MKVKFWGVRGSIPQPTSEYIRTEKYGGNTTCLVVEFEDHTIIFDAGTGINAYGHNCGKRKDFMLIFTHFHHDHVHGFPFFLPIFLPERRIHFYSPKIIKNHLSMILENEFDPPVFPYRFENTISIKYFSILAQIDSIRLLKVNSMSDFRESMIEAGFGEGEISSKSHEFPNWKNVHCVVHRKLPKLPNEIARIDIMENLAHPNSGTYIYKVSTDEKSFVFATDIEGKVGGSTRLVNFCKDVDYLIHDAQYTPEEYLKFQDFGHSNYEMACDHAIQSNVKTLYLTHHDPWSSDDDLDELGKQAEKYIKEKGGEHIKVIVAKEGDTF